MMDRTAAIGIGRDRRGLVPVLVLLIVSLGLFACGDSVQQVVDEQYHRTRVSVEQLGRYISEGRLRNALLVQRYARYVAKSRADVADMAKELEREGTIQGLAYRSLVDRLNKVDKKPADEKKADAAVDEMLRVQAAADPLVYNDSLIDVVNVLADLSEGKLPRLNLPQDAERPREGAGGHLVGNPRYGEWRRDGSGNSFWAWYGQYALFSSLFFRAGPYYYHDWYPRRGWSYYGNVGRHYYGTRADTSRWNRARTTYPNARQPKTYGRLNSSRRLSTYGRSASRGQGGSLKRASAYSSSSRSRSRSGGSRGK